jgi:molybdopterin synthase catalytic subunit
VSGHVVLSRISSTPITAADCLAAVSERAAGGIGVFVGVVRNNDHERAVQSLSYEAHPSAESTLALVCEEITASHDVVAVAAEHRTGDLAIGDVAVVVAVSAEHRAQALDATRDLIDAIKGGVPIWKRQLFSDGTEEWVGCP